MQMEKGSAREPDPEVRAALARLHPVGRLDADTEGLLLLTNDGELTHALTHPSHEVGKTYHAWVRGVPGPQALRRLREGLAIEGRRTSPARARLLRKDVAAGEAQVEVEIHEGRKRQVRHMLAAVGHPVTRLKRVRIGPLALGSLPAGTWRFLTAREVAALKAAASQKPAGRSAPAERCRKPPLPPPGRPKIRGRATRTGVPHGRPRDGRAK